MDEKKIRLFWEKVNILGPDDCWEWIGFINNRGYGRFREGYAHRFSYEIHYGEIPKGCQVLHTCDNPPCCNPKHIWLGTHQENMDDKVSKDRQSRAGRCGNPKLTPEKVRHIVTLLEVGESRRGIASRFGVSENNISSIAVGRIWSHVTGIVT